MQNNPRLIRAARLLERRTFLKALGVGLSLPIAARLARIATAQPTPAPKRFMVMYIPHGIAPEHYNPRVGSDATQFDLDQTNESILAPLQPYKQWVNVYQGFKYADKGGTHEGIVNCLSGVATNDGTTKRVTLDQVIGKGLGVKPLILGACAHLPTNFDLHGMLFWDGTAIEPEKDPSKVADRLFGAGSAPAQPAPTVNADVELRNELLKLTESEIQGLQTTVTGLTREQTKLQAHLEAVRALQANGGNGGPTKSSCSTRPTLPTVEKVRQESAGQVIEPSGANDYFYQEANFRKLLQAQLEVAAQALVCNVAQVVGLMPMYATAEFNFSFVGGDAPPGGWAHHTGITHTQFQGTGQYDSPISIDNVNPKTRTAFGKAQRWFHQMLVDNLVSVLATTPDPASTDPSKMVLDNTLIYLMSEISDGALHERVSKVLYPQFPAHLPLVTIGKCGGAIKSGQVVNFPIGKEDMAEGVARPATELYLTFARAMGAMDATFPGAAQVVPGVLAT
jgi:hypothetical protein